MATVRWTPQDLAAASGITPTYNGSLSAADTYVVRNDGRVFLHAKKTGAGDCTVTVATGKTVSGLAVADQTDTVPASTGDRMIGPFPIDTYNDGAGDISITLSNVAGLSIAVVRLP